MDLNLSITRFTFLILTALFMSACSRSNDVTFPQQAVAADVDCSVADLGFSAIQSIVATSTNKDESNSLLFDIGETNGGSFAYDVSALSRAYNLSVEQHDTEGTLLLEDSTELLDVSINAVILRKGDLHGESERVEFGKPAEYVLLAGLNPFRLIVDVSLTFVEENKDCFYLSEKIEDEDEVNSDKDSGEDKYRRTDTKRFFVDIDLTVRDDLLTTDELALPASLSSVGDQYGASVSSDGNFLAVGAPLEDGSGAGVYKEGDYNADNASTDSGAVYLFQKISGSWELTRIIKASNARAGDQFGSQVVIVGNHLIITAPYEDRGGGGVNIGAASDQTFAYDRPDSGAVYIFNLYEFDSDSPIVESAYVKSPDNSANLIEPSAHFGESISLSPNWLAIGAPNQAIVNTAGQLVKSGKVYVFNLDELGTWSSTIDFKALLEGENDQYGASVSISDAYLVVGAPGDSTGFASVVSGSDDVLSLDITDSDFDPTSPLSGAAYVYFLNEELSLWGRFGYLKASNRDASDGFGESVVVQDDAVFVGAPNEDSSSSINNADMSNDNLTNSGAVYYFEIYTNTEGGEVNVAMRDYIKSVSPDAQANFGARISADLDYLAVASPKVELDSGTSIGVVSILDRSNEFGLVGQLSFEDYDPAPSEQFGLALELDAGKVLVGAPGANKDSVLSGDFRLYE